MIVKCPECELQVSNRALTCPHCGYPLKSDTKPTTKKNKRRRLPNGFGQISEIKNKRLNKPFRAMVTVGKTNTGKAICKPLKPNSYFKTYNEAYTALMEYNKNPYDIEDNLSVFELYEKWSENYFKSITQSSKRTVTAAWAYCSSLYNMRVCELRVRHIKGCVENASIDGKPASPHIKSRIKSLFNLMLDYALECELIDKNYARMFKLSGDIVSEKESGTRGHMPFTEEEIKKLWDNVNLKKYIDIVLIQCYTGMRPQELGLIELKNVDLDNWTIIGGMKTEAGTNRLIPIHTKIRPLIQKRYEQAIKLNSQYLLNCDDATTHKNNYKLTYDKYRHRFLELVNELNLNQEHRAHDGRMHFITIAKKYNVDEYAIKYIVGHKVNDITEKVYTKRENEWFKNEIEKIK